jgi:hypothetical protein
MTDVGVIADSEEAERLAYLVVREELDRARELIKERLEGLGVEVSLQ